MTVIAETERLLVRPWTGDPADLAHLCDMYSRPEVIRWFGGGIPPLTSPAEAVALLRRWAARGSGDGWYGIWAVELRGTGQPAGTGQLAGAGQVAGAGQLVGTAMLKQLPGTDDVTLTDDIEVGWHLHPEHWGNGYATEVARALVAREFDHRPTEVVYAVTDPENEASKAVTRRLGMTYLGRRTDWYGGIGLDTFVLRREDRPVTGSGSSPRNG